MKLANTIALAAARATRAGSRARSVSAFAGSPNWHQPRRSFAATAAPQQRYGFIGLGNMGLPMAENLCAKLTPADSVRVFDLNPDAAPRLLHEIAGAEAQLGALVQVAENAFDVAKDSDVVVTVLPAAEHVKSVLSAILTAELPHNPSRLFIDCSTIDPVESKAIASMIPASLGTLVDAPMSGGVRGATLSTLTFMLGSPKELVPVVSQTLLFMGSRVLHCGPGGAGLAAKLANNYVLAMQNLAVAEAMNLGLRLGIDPKTLSAVINASTGRCWSSEVNNPVPGVVDESPAAVDYEGGFAVALMNKDLGQIESAREAVAASMPCLGKAREVYEELELQGLGRKDFSVVYRYLAGVDAKTRQS